MVRRFGILGVVIVLALVVLGGFFLAKQFEWHDPVVSTDLDGEAIGLRPFQVTVRDDGKGLAYVAVSLITADKSQTLLFEEFEEPLNERVAEVRLDPAQLKEGPAILRVTAADRSYWGFLRGNKTVVDKPVRVDLTPPTVEIVKADRYITLGGSGLVVFRASPDIRAARIRIGHHTFPGYRNGTGDGQTFIAFFAHPYDISKEKRAAIVVEDKAGNTAAYPLTYNLRTARYRNVNVKISDDFIETKVRPLLPGGDATANSASEQFIAVNRELRRRNEDTISKACRGSKAERLWEGRFMQLSNSQVQANFADRRSYVYEGQVIDEAYHLGYDLAVTRRYPVEAANGGIVVFAGPLGIYGNTVILDHGFGVCTLYSHLSAVNVAVGDGVRKGQKVGRTGETGLATGDHLHYAVYIYGVPVLPLEWWDAKWITDNVLSKLGREPSELDGNVMR